MTTSKAIQFKKNTVTVSHSDGEVISVTASLEDATQVVYSPNGEGFTARTVRGATVRIVDAHDHPAMRRPEHRSLRRY